MLTRTITKNVYDSKANDLLNVVADVKSYSDFIPFCSNVDIYEKSGTAEQEHFSACLSIDFKFTIENFETKVVVDRKFNTISISGDTKPFKSMIADWSFIEKENFCEVTFSMAVSFSSFIKEKIVSISFEKIALNVIDAFERKARE